MDAGQQRFDLVKSLFSFYGLEEWTGRGESNPEVEKLFQEMGYDYSDDTAWCSAFANYIAKENCLDQSNALDARSWLQVGKEVESPQIGDIVVFWRESIDSWKGHVAFFMNKDDRYIYVLGGNQSNEVNIKAYPLTRVLGYRSLI